MRLLSVVGLKTIGGRRTTLVQSTYSTSRRGARLSRRIRHSAIFFALLIGIFLQVNQYPFANKLQDSVVNFLSPITAIISKPYEWGVNVINLFSSTAVLIEENKALKLQNDHLLRRNHEHSQIYQENEKLKSALNVKNIVTEDIVTARITHHIFDGYSATYFIGVTGADDIKKNDPVLTTSGYLIGRIISVGNKNSRFMPITDVSSRVPVQISGTGEHAILVGTGKLEFNLTHIENADSIEVGQELVTSGVGGIFAPGIPVAVVRFINGDKVTASPLATCNDLDFVLVISQFQE